MECFNNLGWEWCIHCLHLKHTRDIHFTILETWLQSCIAKMSSYKIDFVLARIGSYAFVMMSLYSDSVY